MKPYDEILTPPNEKPITEIFAVLSVDPDGSEGVCATGTREFGMMPLIVAYSRLVPMLREKAAEISKVTGKTVRLVRFASREEMETFYPAPPPTDLPAAALAALRAAKDGLSESQLAAKLMTDKKTIGDILIALQETRPDELSYAYQHRGRVWHWKGARA